MPQGGNGGGQGQGQNTGAPVGSMAASPTHRLGRAQSGSVRVGAKLKGAVRRSPTAGTTRVRKGALPKLGRGRKK